MLIFCSCLLYGLVRQADLTTLKNTVDQTMHARLVGVIKHQSSILITFDSV